MKLLNFPTSIDHRIKSNIARLEKDLWNAENGEYVSDILRLCEEYVINLPSTVESSLALVNLQTTIIILDRYFQGNTLDTYEE